MKKGKRMFAIGCHAGTVGSVFKYLKTPDLDAGAKALDITGCNAKGVSVQIQLYNQYLTYLELTTVFVTMQDVRWEGLET